jgi:hypothetical protein
MRSLLTESDFVLKSLELLCVHLLLSHRLQGIVTGLRVYYFVCIDGESGSMRYLWVSCLFSLMVGSMPTENQRAALQLVNGYSGCTWTRGRLGRFDAH